jgi:hypothetical protein
MFLQGYPDVFVVSIGFLDFGAENIRMTMQSEILVAGEDALQTAAMVIMAMAEHYGIDLAKIDTQDPGVVGDGQILSGIKQNFAISGFDIKRQAMFSQQSLAALGNGIFDQGGDGKLHRCSPFSW